MGNVGQHYFLWRYPLGRAWTATPDRPIPITFASKRDGGDFLLYQTDAAGAQQERIGGGDQALLPSAQTIWWWAELPAHYRAVYGDTRTFNGKRQLATVLPQAPLRDRVRPSENNDYEPAISPDGQWLAFVSDRDGNPELYVIQLAFGDDRVLRLTDTTMCTNGHPSWLPDGAGLVYESNCAAGGTFELYRGDLTYTVDATARAAIGQLISPTSPGVVRLTTNVSDDRWPRVSPNGDEVAFFSYRDGNPEIYVVRLDGRGETRITNHPQRDEAPAWSPDGSLLVFNSDRDGDFELYVISRVGTYLQQLTSNTADDGYAVWAP